MVNSGRINCVAHAAIMPMSLAGETFNSIAEAKAANMQDVPDAETKFSVYTAS